MTIKSVTALVLQITGLVAALTGLVKSLTDLFAVRAPVKIAMRVQLPEGYHPPPPPPLAFWDEYSIFIGPIVLVVGAVVFVVARRVRRSL